MGSNLLETKMLYNYLKKHLYCMKQSRAWQSTAGVHISESNQKSYLFCYLSLFLCLCDKNSSIHNFCWRFLCKFFPLSHKKILISWRKIVFYKLGFQSALSTLHKKWSFPIKIFSVNVTKSARNCGFSHIYWRNL